MKKLKYLIIVLLVFLFTGCKDPFTYHEEEKEYLKGLHYAEMKIKNYGVLELELDADTAPITVTNFMELVNNKYYDGLPIHRVQKDFVVQAGNGAEVKSIKGEFDANGKSNDISHKRGVISMARMGDMSSGYDTASSQFFIMLKDNETLDHYYAAFGKVTKGMENLDKIAKDVKKTDEMGMIQNEEEMPIIEYIKEIEKQG